MIEYEALAVRPHGGRPTVPIVLSAEARAQIAGVMRPAKAEQRVVRRAQALLMMADGAPGTDIARVLGVHVRTVQDRVAAADEPSPPPTCGREAIAIALAPQAFRYDAAHLRARQADGRRATSTTGRPRAAPVASHRSPPLSFGGQGERILGRRSRSLFPSWRPETLPSSPALLPEGEGCRQSYCASRGRRGSTRAIGWDPFGR